MKITRIVTACNEDPTYIDFIPSITKMWKKYGYPISCGLITDKSEDNEKIKEIRKYCDIILFKPVTGVNSGNQAKVTRLFLSSCYINDVCMIVDIDYYLFKPSYFENNASLGNEIVITGRNGYDGTSDEGKFPMCGIVGKGYIFKEIINPNDNTYYDLINSWKYIDGIDGKESLTKELYEFSDESLLRYLLNKWDKKELIKWVDRSDMKKMHAEKRIDMRLSTSWSISKLYQNHYIDCQPLRPFLKNYEKILPILQYLK